MRRITCTNITDNVSVVFNGTFQPFVLNDVEGIYAVDVNVNTTDNSMTDGSIYVGSNVNKRNIVLTFTDVENHMSNRNLLYLLFKPKTVGVFTYEEEENGEYEKRLIQYVVEKIEHDGKGKQARRTVVSLICADPFFSAESDTVIPMTVVSSFFEFPHEFLAAGEELGTRVSQKLMSFENQSSVNNIGITISMTAEGPVTNPKMYHVENDAYIQLGTDDDPFDMVFGDEIIITTEVNNKNAYLIRGGVMTNVNAYIDEDSEYIQLNSGTNTLRYSAVSGEDSLLVSVRYREKYQGV